MKALLFLSLPVFFVLAGCSSIRSKQPVGLEPVDLSQSLGEIPLASIVGEWVDADGEVTSISVINAKKGELLFTSVDEDVDDDPVTLTLRKSGDHIFVNFAPDDKGERVWALMKIQGEMKEILAWSPDVALFRELIESGAIKGTNDPLTTKNENGEEIKNHSPGAVIDDPKGEWLEKMIAGEFGVLFDWQSPTVLRKRESGGAPAEGEPEAVAEPAAATPR